MVHKQSETKVQVSFRDRPLRGTGTMKLVLLCLLALLFVDCILSSPICKHKKPPLCSYFHVVTTYLSPFLNKQ